MTTTAITEYSAAALEQFTALVEGGQPAPRNATAVIDGQIATVRIERGTPPELVIEDDTDRVAILLTGDVAFLIADALRTHGYLEGLFE